MNIKARGIQVSLAMGSIWLSLAASVAHAVGFARTGKFQSRVWLALLASGFIFAQVFAERSFAEERHLGSGERTVIHDVVVACDDSLGTPLIGKGTSGGTEGNRPFNGTIQAAIEDAKDRIIAKCEGVISSTFETLTSKCEGTVDGGYRVTICSATVRGYCKK